MISRQSLQENILIQNYDNRFSKKYINDVITGDFPCDNESFKAG